MIACMITAIVAASVGWWAGYRIGQQDACHPTHEECDGCNQYRRAKEAARMVNEIRRARAEARQETLELCLGRHYDACANCVTAPMIEREDWAER